MRGRREKFDAPRVAAALAALRPVGRTGMNQTSGRHFAFIPGGGLFPAASAICWPMSRIRIVRAVSTLGWWLRLQERSTSARSIRFR